jgi:hypothetical protein
VLLPVVQVGAQHAARLLLVERIERPGAEPLADLGAQEEPQVGVEAGRGGSNLRRSVSTAPIR